MLDNPPYTDVGGDTLPTPHRNARKGIPLETFIYYKVEKKLSNSEIALILGCSERNVGKRLEGQLEDWETLPAYKKHRADILTLKQREIIREVTPEKIKEAKLSELTKSHGELHHAERLERGESTANIHSYREIVQERKRVEEELEAVNKEMGAVEVKGVRLLPMKEEEGVPEEEVG